MVGEEVEAALPVETTLTKQPNPLVDVVIVHHNGIGRLQECLKSLSTTEYNNLRILIVDNNSNEELSELADKSELKPKIIRSRVNLGFAGGNNLALRDAEGEYVALINDDTAVEPRWLNHLVKVAEGDPMIAACQPKLLWLADDRYFEYNGCAGGMLDVYGVPLARGRLFDCIEEDKGQYDSTVETFWASGAAILLRTSVVRESGLLDELFFAEMEEIDLCWRIRLLGYTIVCVPESVVYHLGGGTPLPNKYYLKERNNLFMMMKNYSSLSLLRFMPFRVFLDCLSLAIFASRRDIMRVTSVLKAYAWVVLNIPSIYRRRLSIQKFKRRVPDKDIIKSMVRASVVVQFFLMNRTYFSQLSGLPKKMSSYFLNPDQKQNAEQLSQDLERPQNWIRQRVSARTQDWQASR